MISRPAAPGGNLREEELLNDGAETEAAFVRV